MQLANIFRCIDLEAFRAIIQICFKCTLGSVRPLRASTSFFRQYKFCILCIRMGLHIPLLLMFAPRTLKNFQRPLRIISLQPKAPTYRQSKLNPVGSRSAATMSTNPAHYKLNRMCFPVPSIGLLEAPPYYILHYFDFECYTSLARIPAFAASLSRE